MGRKRKPILFKEDDNGCFICTSHVRNQKGYPMTKRNGSTMHVHRYVWEEYNGRIPKGMVVRHKCDNPACMRLNHLEIGTVADNNRDMTERGRYAGFLKGEDNQQSVLTEKQVKQIKHDKAHSGYALAKMFNVCKKTIYMIRNGVTWKHI